MGSISVTKVDDLVVVAKSATGDRREALRSEAHLLEELAHPGLVEYVELTESAGAVVLHTVFAGADTWAGQPVTDGVERAAGIAAVAATLAEIHERGVAHGALRAEHVIHGLDGRPRLCGLSRARPADDESRQADLIGLADLIDDPPLGGGVAARALATLAARIRSERADAAEVVTTANRIAAGVGPARRRSGHSRRMVALRVGAVGLIAITTIAMVGASDRGAASRRQPPSTPLPPTPTGAVQPTTIVHDGRIYELGRPGDISVLGDWDCDGIETAAILRPTTGEIAVFDRWPAPGEAMSVTSQRVVPEAEELAVTTEDGCDRLQVRTPQGPRPFDAGRP